MILLDVILLFTRAFLNTSCSRNFLHVCLALQCSSLCYCWKPVPSLKIHLSSLENLFFSFFYFFISVVLSFCQDEAQSPLTYCVLGSQMLGLFQSFQSWVMADANFSNKVPPCWCCTTKDTQCPEQHTIKLWFTVLFPQSLLHQNSKDL